MLHLLQESDFCWCCCTILFCGFVMVSCLVHLMLTICLKVKHFH